MSQFTDEYIQQLAERGRSLPDVDSAGQAIDVKLYQQLFGELKKELPLQPGALFSGRVMSRINGIESASSKPATYVWLWIGLSLCLLGTIFIVAPIDWIMTDLRSVLSVLKPIKWVLVFCVLSLVVVQLLDFKLIREPSLSNLM